MTKKRCVVCNKKIKVMAQQGTGFCCGQCEKKGS